MCVLLCVFVLSGTYELMEKRLAVAIEAIACFERHAETTRNKQHARQASAILKEETQNASSQRATNLLGVVSVSAIHWLRMPRIRISCGTHFDMCVCVCV